MGKKKKLKKKEKLEEEGEEEGGEEGEGGWEKVRGGVPLVKVRKRWIQPPSLHVLQERHKTQASPFTFD